ncbi:MAG: DUF502 domain-containing protein [Dehalococcoidales bacterium]|nr:DUF502 domain-containing protein [Dehalococcoidales bacterium]
MKEGYRLSWSRLYGNLKSHFITGILVLVPVGVTIFVLVWLFRAIDNILQPIIRNYWSHAVPGVGIVATVVIIYLIGVIASNFIGKKLINYGESMLGRVPLVRQLYSGVKQILESFSMSGKTGFMQVVLVEFPSKGMRAIGFVTNEMYQNPGGKLLSVFIPTSPNPTTGFLQIVREEDVIRTKMSVDDAIKMVVSAGRMAPKGVSYGLSEKN